MVNRFWPLKWVGFSNNQRYKNVQAAARNYANVLNRTNFPNAGAKNEAVAEAKRNLQNKINNYIKNIPAGAPPPPAGARPGIFSRFRRTPPAPPTRIGEMPAPGAPRRNIAGALGPLQASPVNGKINGARVRANSTSTNYQPANVFLYQGQYFSPHNGRYTEVKRNGLTGANFTKFKAGNINGVYIRQNVKGKAVFTPFTPENPQNTQAYKNFKAFYNAGIAARGGNMAQLASNYLNRSKTNINNIPNYGTMNWNSIRRWQGSANALKPNGATRQKFWTAVATEMARRAAAKTEFNAWFGNNARSGATPANKAKAYVAMLEAAKANPSNLSLQKAFIRRRNNNKANSNAARKAFWNAVNGAVSNGKNGGGSSWWNYIE